MSSARDTALKVETEFLAGVQANLSQFGSRLLRGAWFEVSERDDAESVRAALVDSGLFDRELLKRMPLGRTLIHRGYERAFLFFGRREVSTTMATVLAPPGPLLKEGGGAPPVTLAELRAHVRKLAGTSRTPTLVAVCSPSGFEPDAWESKSDLPNVKVVLVAPRGDGPGWRLKALWDHPDERLLRIFDAEGAMDKITRIRAALDARGGDLLTGGVSAERLAADLDLPPQIVERGLEMICRADPELRVSRQSGELLVFRGAPVSGRQEEAAMSLTDWVRSLFSRKGEEARKINMLSERRAALAQRRDRLYEDIGRLEKKEAALVEEGRQNTSPVVRRRLAAQVAQLRQDIARLNTSAAMLNQQINVCSTHIHNLTLIQQGEMAELPSAEELTNDAVRAEELLESLRADVDLVRGLGNAAADAAMTEEEAAVLAEFERADTSRAAPAAAPAAEPRRAEPPERSRAARLESSERPARAAEAEPDKAARDPGRAAE